MGTHKLCTCDYVNPIEHVCFVLVRLYTLEHTHINLQTLLCLYAVAISYIYKLKASGCSVIFSDVCFNTSRKLKFSTYFILTFPSHSLHLQPSLCQPQHTFCFLSADSFSFIVLSSFPVFFLGGCLFAKPMVLRILVVNLSPSGQRGTQTTLCRRNRISSGELDSYTIPCIQGIRRIFA